MLGRLPPAKLLRDENMRVSRVHCLPLPRLTMSFDDDCGRPVLRATCVATPLRAPASVWQRAPHPPPFDPGGRVFPWGPHRAPRAHKNNSNVRPEPTPCCAVDNRARTFRMCLVTRGAAHYSGLRRGCSAQHTGARQALEHVERKSLPRCANSWEARPTLQ